MNHNKETQIEAGSLVKIRDIKTYGFVPSVVNRTDDGAVQIDSRVCMRSRDVALVISCDDSEESQLLLLCLCNGTVMRLQKNLVRAAK